MNPQPGQNLLHYRLVEKIGEGGMGVVWKGVDTTLDREVAIKILPPGFTDDPDRLARFEREARLLASLNHPNIAGVYGLHEVAAPHASGAEPAGPLRFLAMELVPGEDLAERLRRGRLPVEQTLEIARQVAEGLEAAHDQGVIHRDLKPANVRLTPDGKAKVLDFGLAKGLEAASTADADPSLSPTVTSLGTVAGVILGTAAYMSPEQARGTAADRRADVWAFGALLYEMLSGARPFEGDTISDTLAAVLRAEPDWERYQDGVPSAVRRLVRRCLLKDPRRRMQSIGEARVWIEDAIADPGGGGQEPTAAPVAATRGRVFPWVVAAAAVLASSLFFAGWRFSGSDERPVFRSEIGLTPAVSVNHGNNLHLLPGGHRLLFVGVDEGEGVQLWLRDFSEIESRAVPGTAGAILGTVSPDGSWYVFFMDGELKKMSAKGGAPITLAAATSNPRGASWSENGDIYYAPGTGHEIMRVPSAGGEPATVTALPEEGALSQSTNSHRWPTILPGDRGLLYLAGNAGDFAEARIEVLELDSGEVQVLYEGALYPRYLDSGHVAFVRDGAIIVMGFDAETLEVTSPPVAIVDGVQHSFGNGGAQLSVSDNGTLIYIPGQGTQVEIEMHWVAPDEKPSVIMGPEAIFHPRFSPDGKRIAFTKGVGSTSDVWVYDVERDLQTRLTLDANGADRCATWSADGKWITFSSNRGGGPMNLYRKPADGSGKAVRLSEDSNWQCASSWSSDETMLLYAFINGDMGHDIALQRFDENNRAVDEPEILVSSPDFDGHAVFSPDDRFIAYQSRVSGVDQVYVRTADGTGRWQVSDDLGTTPRWADGGRSIYYTRTGQPESEIRVVEFSVENGIPVIGRPRTVLSLPLAFVQTTSATYDVRPTDQRLIALAPMWDNRARTRPILVQDWFEELDP